MIRRPPRSTLFPTRRSSDLARATRTARKALLSGTYIFDRLPPSLHEHFADRGGRLLQSGCNPPAAGPRERRSEEHTSELQSRQYLVCRLLLEKKKKINKLTV